MKKAFVLTPRTAADPDVYFHKSIMDGVEIKQCNGTAFDFKAHVHAELSIGYIVSGATELCLGDRTLNISAGDGVIIPPLFSHSCSPLDTHRWQYVMVYIRPDRYENTARFNQTRKLEGRRVHRLTGYVTRLLAAPNPDAAAQILEKLLLDYSDTVLADQPDTGAVALVRDYIAGHLCQPITLEELEDLSGLNKFTLIRNFKKTYVTTPASFHLQCRIAEAKARLNEGCDVLTLCSELNFYDQAHLIKEFRKMYGITPSAYLKQLNA